MNAPDPAAVFAERARPAISAAIARSLPGARVVAVSPIAPDDAGADVATKAAGYGLPLDVRVELPGGASRRFVFHTAGANEFGHDRRADRAAEMLLAFDTFDEIPRHVRAVDVGAIRRDDGGLVSLHEAGEFYLLTEYAEGRIYADDLRRVARERRASEQDRVIAKRLARYLRELHAEPLSEPVPYRRSIRDLIGSGEGIFGMIDGYPEAVPGAPPERLERIEVKAASWRWRLRGEEARVRRIHGDFHPFNIVIDTENTPCLLDASRGSRGDPADDVTCLAINFVFFAIEAPGSWRDGLRPLWFDFWDEYLAGAGDPGLLLAAPPFLAWRGLVLANPVWYPRISVEERETMLGFIEAVLDAGRFDPASADELFP